MGRDWVGIPILGQKLDGQHVQVMRKKNEVTGRFNLSSCIGAPWVNGCSGVERATRRGSATKRVHYRGMRRRDGCVQERTE